MATATFLLRFQKTLPLRNASFNSKATAISHVRRRVLAEPPCMRGRHAVGTKERGTSAGSVLSAPVSNWARG
jgi:hypothetical protein